MKKFYLYISLFAVTLFLVAVVLDLAISYKLRHSDMTPYKCWDVVYNDTTDYDIVINGSSRAYVQYDPIILDTMLGYKTYNLGMDGSSINRQIIKYWMYCKKHNTTPKLLIQNIDFLVLRITKGYEREQFFPYFFYDRQMIEEFDKYEEFDWEDKYVPLIRYYGLFPQVKSGIVGHRELTKGYLARDDKWDGGMFRKQDTIEIGKDKEAIMLLDEFTGEVKRSGTEVIFVYSPIYAGVNKKIDVNEMYGIFQKIATKHNVPILNYNEIELCNDTNMFYNATHLNRTGSQIFTKMLASDIDSLINTNKIHIDINH